MLSYVLLAYAAFGFKPERFLYANRLVFVEATVNDQSGKLFLLDTGANKTALNEALVKEQSLKVLGSTTIEGTTGTASVTHLRLDRLSVAGQAAKGLDVTVQSLQSIPGPTGRHIDGILGTDFLRGRVVRIDYRNGTIAFPKRTLKPGPRTIPFTLDNGIPRLKGTLEGEVPADFRLDTGASLFETADVYLNVPTSLWNDLTRRDPGLKPEKFFTGGGVGGTVHLSVVRIGRLQIGPVEVERPWIIVQPEIGYFARPDAVGFFSNNLLEKYGAITLDFKSLRLTLGEK